MSDHVNVPAMPVHPAFQEGGRLMRFQTYVEQRPDGGPWACVLRVFEQPPPPPALPGLPPGALRSVDVDAQEFWCGEFATEAAAKTELSGPFRALAHKMVNDLMAKHGGQIVAAEFGGD